MFRNPSEIKIESKSNRNPAKIKSKSRPRSKPKSVASRNRASPSKIVASPSARARTCLWSDSGPQAAAHHHQAVAVPSEASPWPPGSRLASLPPRHPRERSAHRTMKSLEIVRKSRTKFHMSS